jgi:hypothetical protein
VTAIVDSRRSHLTSTSSLASLSSPSRRRLSSQIISELKTTQTGTLRRRLSTLVFITKRMDQIMTEAQPSTTTEAGGSPSDGPASLALDETSISACFVMAVQDHEIDDPTNFQSFQIPPQSSIINSTTSLATRNPAAVEVLQHWTPKVLSLR